MKTKELRDKNIEELQKLLDELLEDLSKVDFSIKSAEESNISKRKFLRKDIARVKTVMSEQIIEKALTPSKETKKTDKESNTKK